MTVAVVDAGGGYAAGQIHTVVESSCAQSAVGLTEGPKSGLALGFVIGVGP